MLKHRDCGIRLKSYPNDLVVRRASAWLESLTSTKTSFKRDSLNQQRLTDLAADLGAYVAGSRDSKRELDLLQRTRALPQAMREQLLVPLLDLNATVALVLIHRAQLSRAAYLAVFQRGLDEADASSIYQWMAATIVHLGWQKVFSVLRQELTVRPHRVAAALYHVPALCGGEQTLSGSLPTTILLDEFCQLVVLCHARGYMVCTDERAFQVIIDRARRAT